MSEFPSMPTATSEMAAESVDASKAEIQRERVFNLIKSTGTDGATDEEIQEKLQLPGNTQRPRRWELSHKQGRISISGTRVTKTGRRASVWVANQHPTIMDAKTKQPKQVTVVHKRNGNVIRRFKSFVTGRGNVQVITFPQAITCLSGDTVSYE